MAICSAAKLNVPAEAGSPLNCFYNQHREKVSFPCHIMSARNSFLLRFQMDAFAPAQPDDIKFAAADMNVSSPPIVQTLSVLRDRKVCAIAGLD